MLKSRGPKIDDCGISVIMSDQALKEEPVLFICLQLFR